MVFHSDTDELAFGVLLGVRNGYIRGFLMAGLSEFTDFDLCPAHPCTPAGGLTI